MVSLDLPAELAPSYELAVAGTDDLADLRVMLSAYSVALYGYDRSTEARARMWIESTTPEEHLLALTVRRRDTRALVQVWGAGDDVSSPHPYMIMRSHPDLPIDVADALWAAVVPSLFDWIRQVCLPDAAEPVVDTGHPAKDGPGCSRITRSGFVHTRSMWEMVGTVPGRPATTSVPGLTVRPASDHRQVHAMMMETFVDAIDYEQLSYDDWEALEHSLGGYDPTLWFVADLDGEPAGAIVSTRALAGERRFYVQELGVRAAFRRRGIGTALLRHAFDLAHSEGFTSLSLHVTSDNASGAPSLYRHLGLEDQNAISYYRRQLDV